MKKTFLKRKKGCFFATKWLCFVFMVACSSLQSLPSGQWVTEIPEEFGVSKDDLILQRKSALFYQGDRHGGNELFVLGHPETVYLSGNLPYKNIPSAKTLGCRTMLHIVLGDKDAKELIVANRLLFEFKKINKCSNTIDIQSAVEKINIYVDAFGPIITTLLGVSLAEFIQSLRDISTLKGKELGEALGKVDFSAVDRLEGKVKDGIKTYFQNMEDYWVKTFPTETESFNPLKGNILYAADPINRPLQELLSAQKKLFDSATHTERMLIYDRVYSGFFDPLPNYSIIFSKQSMCSTCEPAMAEAFVGLPLLVVSEVYHDRDVDSSRDTPLSNLYKMNFPLSVTVAE